MKRNWLGNLDVNQTQAGFFHRPKCPFVGSSQYYSDLRCIDNCQTKSIAYKTGYPVHIRRPSERLHRHPACGDGLALFFADDAHGRAREVVLLARLAHAERLRIDPGLKFWSRLFFRRGGVPLTRSGRQLWRLFAGVTYGCHI
ncbi:hypothetical protein MPL1032_180014 [Mesorhizobium plurifarium]|uniref:Uncharacterized protein n=1 Tax=Mesorhizobium plurifarium TaxID=69974 RepID=A0A0K2VTE9_MESPL|nr:hypothetical protein MPL1032_180014 [Mesorhizobium plurifarium]